MISDTTGNPVSAQGAWVVVQKLGERIVMEEDAQVAQMNSGTLIGEKELQVLFEEMDGVWLRQQGEHHEKLPMMEVKVSTTYEGWDEQKEEEGRSALVGRHILAGIESSDTFHDKHEAEIRKRYNADEIGCRILNGDGGSWIGDPNDPDAVVQLDPFHVHMEIRRCIADKRAQADVEASLADKDIDGALSRIAEYADGLRTEDAGDEKKMKAAERLREYLANNKECLVPWRDRGLAIPEPPEGVIYKGMGVQEGENCSVITLRMKHRRMRWGKSGGNNMAKALYRKANGELHETIGRYSGELALGGEAAEVVEVLSAAKAPTRDGAGDPYADALVRSVPILEAALTEGRKAFRNMASGKGAM